MTANSRFFYITIVYVVLCGGVVSLCHGFHVISNAAFWGLFTGISVAYLIIVRIWRIK